MESFWNLAPFELKSRSTNETTSLLGLDFRQHNGLVLSGLSREEKEDVTLKASCTKHVAAGRATTPTSLPLGLPLARHTMSLASMNMVLSSSFFLSASEKGTMEMIFLVISR